VWRGSVVRWIEARNAQVIREKGCGVWRGSVVRWIEARNAQLSGMLQYSPL